jgi:hypothetical protein
MLLHIDFAFCHRNAFSFEQTPLQAGMRLRDQEPSAGADNAVPRNAAASRASGHSVTSGTRSAAQPQRAGNFTVRCNAAARDFLYECIHTLPRHFISRSPMCRIRCLKRVAGSAIHPAGLSGIFYRFVQIVPAAP